MSRFGRHGSSRPNPRLSTSTRSGRHFSTRDIRRDTRPRGFVHHRSVVFLGNGTGYIASWADRLFSIFTSLFVIGLIASIFTMFFGLSYKDDMKLIKEEHSYYCSVIDYAEANTDYLIDGVIMGKVLNTDCNKYYIRYYFTSYSGKRIENTTFSIYTKEQADAFISGATIKLAVDSLPLTLQTDSINVDYKNSKLTDDGEYVKAEKKFKTFTTVSVSIGVVSVIILITGIVVRAKATNRKGEDEYEEQSSTPSTTPTQEFNTQKFCCYCGGRINSSIYCPYCGEKQK